MTEFFTQLKQLLSVADARILDKQQATLTYGKTTFSTPIALDAAVKVETAREVCELMALANKLGFHLYPVSSAKNWGYGSVYDL